MAIPRPVTKTKIATVSWGIPITDEVNRLTDAVGTQGAIIGGIWRRVGGLTLTQNANVTVPWDAEDLDTNNFMVVNGTNVSIPAGMGGIYSILFNAAVGATGACHVVTPWGVLSATPDLQTGWATAQGITRLNALDGFYCRIWNTSATATTPNCARLEVFKIK